MEALARLGGAEEVALEEQQEEEECVLEEEEEGEGRSRPRQESRAG